MESLHPSEIDLGLQRVHAVAKTLGLLDFTAKVITVAGTNGKGSFVCALDAMLSSQNKRVGTYTSPHIQLYNERIKIAGDLASDESICQAFEAIDTARGEISLTYFEFGTLAALYLFKQAQLDYIVLEVGLGGRLDAVNIIDADVAVITSIGIDHEAWLGNNREDIAREKAGILRPGIVCICAEQEPPASLVQAFTGMQVSLMQIGQDFGYERGDDGIRVRLGKQEHEVHCSLPAPSLAAAMICVEQLGCSVEHALPALQNLQLAGRLEKLNYKGKQILADVAHNPAAGLHLADNIRRLGGRFDALVAVMADKDASGLFAPLVPMIDRWYCIELDEKRAMAPENLKTMLVDQLHIPKERVQCAQLGQALNHASDQLLVFGSFYLISDLKAAVV